MSEYHKIKTVWERDPKTKYKTLIEMAYAKPEFEYLANQIWQFTEKVDGTNIRIIWDGEKVTYGGRTERAMIYAPLIERLQELFYAGAMSQVFNNGDVTLYGEGYGAKIQKGGGNYLSDSVDFILFDIKIGDIWLARWDVEDIGRQLGINVVPIVGEGTLINGILRCRDGLNSNWGDFQAEGLVMRPKIELKDRMGHRIITKIKCKDFS